MADNAASDNAPPPLSEPTLDLLKELRDAVQAEEYDRIVDSIGPSLLFEDRLHYKPDDDDEDNEQSRLLMSIYQLYFQALLLQGAYEKVVQLLSPVTSTTKGGSHNNKSPQQQQQQIPTAFRPRLEPARLYAMYRLERYPAVAAAASAATAVDDDDDFLLRHLHAQALHHLQDARGATAVYNNLLRMEVGDDKHLENVDDGDIREPLQCLNNVVALQCATLLPYVRQQGDALAPYRSQLAAVLGNTEHEETRRDEVDEDDEDYAFDLAYNLATYDLGTAGHSPSTLDTGRSLLQHALRAKQSREGDAAERAKEVAPLEWCLEWSRWLWQGTPADVVVAVPKHGTTATRLVAMANQALSSSSNSSKPRDAVRLLPKPNPTVFTPLQNHLLFYNRAVLHYRAQQLADCRATCTEWTASMVSVTAAMAANNKKKTNKNKQQQQNKKQAPQNGESSTDANHSPSVVVKLVLTPVERLFWEARIAVLEALCLDKGDKDSEKAQAASRKRLDDQLTAVQSYMQQQNSNAATDTHAEVLDHVLLYLQTHRAALQETQEQQQQGDTTTASLPLQKGRMELLQSLPKEKGVIATLASLYHQQGQPDQALTLLQESGHKDALADFLLTQGRYAEVVDLLADKTDVVSRARRVQALSYMDNNQAAAHEAWRELEASLDASEIGETTTTSTVNGAQLELKELPRMALKHHKTPAVDTATAPPKPKRSHEAVLRRRARLRERHVAARQAQGLSTTTATTTTTPPDPERWLPKYERAYHRRRRNHQKQHKGAQGGVSEKEAAKLDVAARKSKPATATTTSSTSTAHMTAVSSGGGRKGKGRR